MNASVACLSGPGLAWEPVCTRASWENLFSHVARPHLTQSWGYGEAKRAEGWSVERLVWGGPHTRVALCQLLVKRLFGMRITRINRGPLFLEEPITAQSQVMALSALRRRWRYGRNGLLLVAPSLPSGEPSNRLLRDAGFRPRSPFAWGSSLIDLDVAADELFRRLSPEWRTKLRRAERLGVSLRVRHDPGAIEWLIERHVDNMQRKGFTGPSPRFIRALGAANVGHVHVLQALIDGEPHAATLIVRFGRHAENFIGWFDERARQASAGNFLMWQSVLEMQRLGCRALDLGGYSVADRYGQFKRGMRGSEYRLAGEWLAF